MARKNRKARLSMRNPRLIHMRQRCNAVKAAILKKLEELLNEDAGRVRVIINPHARRVELELGELSRVLVTRAQHALDSLAHLLGGRYDYSSRMIKLS